MTKEEEEAYAAAVKYEAAENALRAIDGDIAYYERKALQLQNCEAEYQKMLEKKKEQIKNAEIPGAEKIAEIERRLIFLQHQKKEVEEALEALVMLGFARTAAEKAVRGVVRESPAAPVEEVVRMALKRL